MTDEAYRQIPLVDRDGQTVAKTLVDAADYERLRAFGWRLHSRGYVRRAGFEPVYLHRLLLGLERGDPRQADHINRDKLDNRRANLRIVEPGENNQNIAAGWGRSGVRNVKWSSHRGGCWQVCVRLDGQAHHGGFFDDVDDAEKAAIALRRRLMPYATE